MRLASTWIYYGVGLICLGVSAWLVLSPPDKDGHGAVDADRQTGRGENHGPTGDPTEDPGRSSVDSNSSAPSILPAPQQPPEGLEPAERAAWIEKYCAQLAEHSYQKDIVSLERLLSELGSAELEIAESAHHNLMARHDRRAVPYLEQQIAASKSAFEKKRLQELVDFLNTPGILESDLIKKR